MPQVEFDVFRAAARSWLGTAPMPNPLLAAAADVLALACSERQIVDLAGDATDVHAVLGASAVLDLWLAARTSAL